MKFDTPEELASISFQGTPPDTPYNLVWADGFVIALASSSAVSELLVDEILRGTVHWFFVSFAPLENYVPSFEFAGRKCNLVNSSQSPIYKAAADFFRHKALRPSARTRPSVSKSK